MNNETNLNMDRKVRITIEIEMDEYQREQLVISKNTKVLGGNIVLWDWEGGVFDEAEGFRKLFRRIESDLMGIVFDNLKDKDFTDELQLAIKRAVTPIIKAKRKEILEE